MGPNDPMGHPALQRMTTGHRVSHPQFPPWSLYHPGCQRIQDSPPMESMSKSETWVMENRDTGAGETVNREN